MEAYDDIVKEIQKKIRGGAVRLGPRVKASAEARQIIYTKLYPDTKDRERMRRVFNYAQSSAKLFTELIHHYGNNGILAMIPAKLADSQLRGEDRIATIIEVLELVCPHLHLRQLELYSRVIDTIADSKQPDGETLTELDASIVN